MEFAICFKGFVQPDRAKALVRLAESAGFTYCWFYDSHILWRESFAQMAMCMEHTKKMRFGPCVTNPNTRDWSLAASMFGSLALQSNGRFDIGVGRGDSAVRVMGKKPSNLARMEEFIIKVKAMVKGEEVGDFFNSLRTSLMRLRWKKPRFGHCLYASLSTVFRKQEMMLLLSKTNS